MASPIYRIKMWLLRQELAEMGPECNVYFPVLLLRPGAIRLADHVRIDTWVKIEGGQGVTIGPFVHLASFVHVGIGGGEVSIGAYAACASGARILSGSNQPDGLSMSANAPADMQSVKRSKTVIGPYAFLGTGAIVHPGVTVGEGAVIGSGSVVTKDVPPYEVWAGAPAKFLKARNRSQSE